MADVLICSMCRAEVPAGRPWCGRCGGDTAAVAAAASRRFTKPLRLAAAAIPLVLAAVALAMLARPAADPWPATDPRAAKASASRQRSRVAPTASVVAGDAATLPEFTSRDASRAGTAAYVGGDLPSAVSQYAAAVEADPNNAEALNNLGQVLVRLGRAREAIPYFDRAIELADNVWAYHFNRARAYAELKEWRQAIAGYVEASRLFPDDYVTHFNLAKARQAGGDLPGAIDAYAQATRLAPEQADFRLWYGQALDLHGRAQDAIGEYKKFLELDPQAAQAEKVKARLAQLGAPATSTSS